MLAAETPPPLPPIKSKPWMSVAASHMHASAMLAAAVTASSRMMRVILCSALPSVHGVEQGKSTFDHARHEVRDGGGRPHF